MSSGLDQTSTDAVPVDAAAHTAFATELQFRMAEAQAQLDAAEKLDDPLLAQIAAGDLADLQALASRNDVASA